VVSGGQDAEFVKKFENHVPQGKMMSNDELAGALLFLLSDESLAMTGHNLVLDGGFTAW
jgi:enoyl-[acyl-carrier-protein] reductase (NADH)